MVLMKVLRITNNYLPLAEKRPAPIDVVGYRFTWRLGVCVVTYGSWSWSVLFIFEFVRHWYVPSPFSRVFGEHDLSIGSV